MDLSQSVAAIVAAVLTLIPQPAEAKSDWLSTGQMPTDSEVIQRMQAEETATHTAEALQEAPAQQPEQAAAVAPTAPEPPSRATTVAEQIRQTFGPQAPTALRVARCESGLRAHARNGQYRGIFQMGSAERATYGHGPDAATQIAAAYRYFQVSGWTPWRACT